MDKQLDIVLRALEEYRSRPQKDQQYLIEIMKYEGISALGARIYTPGFNDGNACEKTVSFIAPINSVTDSDYYLIEKDEELCVLYLDNIDSIEEHRKYIRRSHFDVLKTKDWGQIKTLEHEYKLAGVYWFLEYYALQHLDTNSEVLITLQDDYLSFRSNYYDCGY